MTRMIVHPGLSLFDYPPVSINSTIHLLPTLSVDSITPPDKMTFSMTTLYVEVA